MTNFSTTYSFWWILICILIGAGYAWLHYSSKAPWSKQLNYALASLRAILVALICFLFLEPFVQTIINYSEKPLMVLAIDNSESISINYAKAGVVDLKDHINQLENKLSEKGYEVKLVDIDGDLIERIDSLTFSSSTTNLSSQLTSIKNDFKERNLEGIVLVSDGIFNEGYSPLALSSTLPIYTIGLGDTTRIKDLSIKEVVHNSTVYEGNSLQLEVLVLNTHMEIEEAKIKIYQQNKLLGSGAVSFVDGQTLGKQVFSVPVTGECTQSMRIVLEPAEGEYTQLNNSSTVYFDVINARKRILILASAPHPDIKAIKTSIEQNEYYEVELAYQLPAKLDYKLIILHQFPSIHTSQSDKQRLLNLKIPAWIIVGGASDFRFLQNKMKVISKDNFAGKEDLVRPVWNPDFNAFTFDDSFLEWISDLPPIAVPYGLSTQLVGGKAMLLRQIGSVETQDPMLVFSKWNEQSIGLLMGTGIWKWKLDEYRLEQVHTNFDALVSKTVQYLSADATKKRFFVAPKKSQYEVGEEVRFATEQYNALFDRVVGNKVTLSLKRDNEQPQVYTYVPLRNNFEYKVVNLKEGVYTYNAVSRIDSTVYRSGSQFVVKKLDKEALNPVADFDMLEKLATKTNATFTPYTQLSLFLDQIDRFNPVSTLHSSEKENLLNNIQWVLLFLMLLVSTEWFLRKFYGGY